MNRHQAQAHTHIQKPVIDYKEYIDYHRNQIESDVYI